MNHVMVEQRRRVEVRVAAACVGPLIETVLCADAAEVDAAAAQRGTRRMYMEGQYREVAVYDRTRLRCGNRLISPAVVEQADSTTVVFPGYRAEVDLCRNLIIARAE